MIGRFGSFFGSRGEWNSRNEQNICPPKIKIDEKDINTICSVNKRSLVVLIVEFFLVLMFFTLFAIIFSTIGINAQIINSDTLSESNKILQELLILEIFIGVVAGCILLCRILSIILQVKMFNKVQSLKPYFNLDNSNRLVDRYFNALSFFAMIWSMLNMIASITINYYIFKETRKMIERYKNPWTDEQIQDYYKKFAQNQYEQQNHQIEYNKIKDEIWKQNNNLENSHNNNNIEPSNNNKEQDQTDLSNK